MTQARFLFCYRIAVLGTLVVWRAATGGSTLHAVVASVMFGIPPFAAIAGLARFIESRWVLLVAAGILAYAEVTVWWDVTHSDRSTAALALAFVPVFMTVTVVPAAALLGWLIRFVRRLWQRRRPSGE